MREGSYTTTLFSSGMNKIAQKVGEEAVELVIEAMDDNKDLFLNEAADLMYHYIVLLQAKGFSLHDVESVLKQRHQK
jgi:phosphoribosyl-ATP pyrophosphohydrolase/phosphoribosyl-AMP cyclohydrolase